MENNFLKSLGSFIAIGLPVAQFFLQWFDKNKFAGNLFIDSELVFSSTLFTFLISIFIVFVTISYKNMRWTPNKKKQRKYQEYINLLNQKQQTGNNDRLEIVEPPKTFNLKEFALISIPIVFIASVAFLYIATTYDDGGGVVALIQSLSYIIFMCLSVFIIMTFTLEKYDQSNYLKNRRERIKKAINLAVENDSFKEMPKITFNFIREDWNVVPAILITEIWVGENKYRVVTDYSANELISVNSITPTN